MDRCRVRPARPQTAFTIIELLVVMSIISIIAGMVVAFWPSPPSPADADILLISAALDRYHQDFRCYPPDTGYGLATDSGSPLYDPGSLWRYLRQRVVDPRTGELKGPYLERWPVDRAEPYDDPGRGKSLYLADPWGNPFGFIGERHRVVHSSAGFDLFSAGRDGVTACREDDQSPSDARAEANRAYNGKDDDGNGLVDDRAELGWSHDNGTQSDDSNNWEN
jgi:prepilin-type N-terminal cleavage/methylation domain-containing protein